MSRLVTVPSPEPSEVLPTMPIRRKKAGAVAASKPPEAPSASMRRKKARLKMPLVAVDAKIFEDVIEALGEIDSPALGQIRRLLASLGTDVVQNLVDAALLIQEAGGVLKRDGTPRSLGGVFFFLVAHHPRGQHVVQPYYKHRIPSDLEPDKPALKWADRASFNVDPKGEVARVKIVVTGRPGQITEAKGFVSTVLSEKKTPSLPKGLPSPPALPTEYQVYLQSKQWRRVEPALSADPTDVLIVEGWCSLDLETERIAVFATNATTRGLQRQKAPAKAAEASDPAPSA